VVRRPVWLAAGIFVFASCEVSPPSLAERVPAVEMIDSAGVQVVFNRVPTPVTQPIEAELETEIGTIAGAPESQLFRVSSALRHEDGRIFVANAGTSEVRVYGSDGSHLYSFGREGDGPAEFRSPKLVLLRGDTVFVQDRTALVLFDAQGVFLDRRTLDIQLLSRLIATPFEGGGWQGPNTYVVPSVDWSPGPPVSGPPFRPPTTFFSVNVVDETIDTIATVGGTTQQFVDVRGGRVQAFILPYSARHVHGGAGGSYVVGDTGEPGFHRLDPEGRHTIVRWAAEPVAITDEDIEEWIALQGGAQRSSARQREKEEVWRATRADRTMPFYGALVATSDGASWLLKPTDTAGSHWMRFDGAGQYDRTVALPNRVHVMDAGSDWVLGLARDQLGVEYLQMYSLTPR